MQIEQFLAENSQPSYRLKQFNQAFYQNLITDFEELSVWPKELREQAKKQILLLSLKPIKTQISKNQDTIKVLFSRNSNPDHKFETVLMKHQDGRNTVCVSCMVGCPMNCSFCATGSMGFTVNLSAQEIVEQVLFFARKLSKTQQKVTNVVFMGMGEPMVNLLATQEAVAILTDRNKLAMSPSRITVSTCGLVTPLKKFIIQGYKGRLAISLHAPNQQLREQVMPVAKTNSLSELISVVDLYTKQTNKRVSYEYILISKLNDQKEHAQELAALLKHKLAHVNLIPYNPVAGKNWTRPNKKTIFAFSEILKRANIAHTIRVTMGEDIAAACGQLATKT
jgi:23S rRNA (adenine2503-C2)-methyltransferase